MSTLVYLLFSPPTHFPVSFMIFLVPGASKRLNFYLYHPCIAPTDRPLHETAMRQQSTAATGSGH